MKQLFFLTLLLLSQAVLGQTPCSLDPTWDGDGKLVADGSRLGEHMLLLPDGKLLVACNPFGDSYAKLKRYNHDGTVDGSFGTGGQMTIQVAERRTDIDGMALHNGVVYLVGSTTTNIGGTNTYVYAAAVTTQGAYVNTFGTNGVKKFNSGSTDYYIASDIAVDANGGIYLTGLEWLDNLFVVKLTATGALDVSWDGDGAAYVPTNNTNHWWDVHDMELDKNGQVMLTGKKYRANNGSTIPNFWNVFVARFNANGSLDNSFATNGIGLYNSAPSYFDDAMKIMVTPSNNYVTAGVTYDGVDYDYSAARILHTGTLDPSFGTGGWSLNDLTYNDEMENCLNAALLPDGRILQTGNQGSGDTVHFALLMLNPDGSRDNVFAPDGVFLNIFNQNNNSSSKGMAVDATGKIYLGGYTRTCANGVCGPLYMALSRYNNTLGPVVGMETAVSTEWLVSPNPAMAGERITLTGITLEDVQSVQVLDMAGQVVSHEFMAGRLELPAIARGVYLVRVTTAQGTAVKKLMVR